MTTWVGSNEEDFDLAADTRGPSYDRYRRSLEDREVELLVCSHISIASIVGGNSNRIEANAQFPIAVNGIAGDGVEICCRVGQPDPLVLVVRNAVIWSDRICVAMDEDANWVRDGRVIRGYPNTIPGNSVSRCMVVTDPDTCLAVVAKHVVTDEVPLSTIPNSDSYLIIDAFGWGLLAVDAGSREVPNHLVSSRRTTM